MNDTQETVEINGIELERGDTLWRVAALRTWETTIGEQDPDAVIREIAEALVEEYPEKVNNAPVNIVEANLKGTPGIYDGTDVMNYHAMEVTEISEHNGITTVAIKDLKEQKTYAFESERAEVYEGDYTTCEPLSALEKHLGVTILPVTEDK